MSATKSPAVPLPVPADANELFRVETTLLEQVRAGDARAFGALVEPHLGMLYRVARRATRDDALAEDAVQETLLVAHRQIGRYVAGTSLRAYLAAIAVRRAQTLLRSEIRRHAREERVSRNHHDASAESVAAAEEMQRRLQQALKRLPQKRREAVLLRLDAGLSHAEIANVVGSTERSVRVLVHLALKELKQMLEDDHE